jgi:hypothetical protein
VDFAAWVYQRDNEETGQSEGRVDGAYVSEKRGGVKRASILSLGLGLSRNPSTQITNNEFNLITIQDNVKH